MISSRYLLRPLLIIFRGLNQKVSLPQSNPLPWFAAASFNFRLMPKVDQTTKVRSPNFFIAAGFLRPGPWVCFWLNIDFVLFFRNLERRFLLRLHAALLLSIRLHSNHPCCQHVLLHLLPSNEPSLFFPARRKPRSQNACLSRQGTFRSHLFHVGWGRAGMITFMKLAHTVDAKPVCVVVALAHMVDATPVRDVVALARRCYACVCLVTALTHRVNFLW